MRNVDVDLCTRSFGPYTTGPADIVLVEMRVFERENVGGLVVEVNFYIFPSVISVVQSYLAPFDIVADSAMSVEPILRSYRAQPSVSVMVRMHNKM